ncbi:MAG: hypothetical protein MK132_05815 [Lentisphaerales bacterium]|nr:hypothetical protein [Lentisphaerales bacterium]
MTELFRKDQSNLPYTSTWKSDFNSGKATINNFSFVEDYMSGGLDIFTCPSYSDADMSELTDKSSYYYVPGTYYLSQLILDNEFAYAVSDSSIIFNKKTK